MVRQPNLWDESLAIYSPFKGSTIDTFKILLFTLRGLVERQMPNEPKHICYREPASLRTLAIQTATLWST